MDEVCDICATPGLGTTVSAGAVRQATKRGFDPAGLHLLPVSPGADLSRSRAMWRMLVEQNDTDWNLCDGCMRAMGPHLGGADAGSGEGAPDSSGGKCFIAAAAFGSPHAVEVEVLREYRDTVLRRKRLGRAFIRFYERTAPPAARWIAPRPTVRLLVRNLLLRPVAAVIGAFLRKIRH